MKRGAVIVCSVQGDYGKPRPAIVVQESRLNEIAESVIVALVTSSPLGGEHIRVTVEPSDGNGLRVTSRIMVDKLYALPKHRVAKHVGQLDDATMIRVDAALRTVLGLNPNS